MSSNSSSFYSSSSISYSNNNGQVSGHKQSSQGVSDASGTTITSSSQNLGEQAQHQTHRFDAQGRQLVGSGTDNRITDVEQAERDREYEERIEEEYAKREGGA